MMDSRCNGHLIFSEFYLVVKHIGKTKCKIVNAQSVG